MESLFEGMRFHHRQCYCYRHYYYFPHHCSRNANTVEILTLIPYQKQKKREICDKIACALKNNSETINWCFYTVSLSTDSYIRQEMQLSILQSIVGFEKPF